MPYIDLEGERTYFEMWGAGTPLVLLHGGYCSLEVMRELAEILAEHFEVHAPERAGHGRTADREGPYSYARMAHDTVAYLDAARLERAHLVGFSDGAIASILVARDYPERVLSIVPISGNLSTDAYRADDVSNPTVDEQARTAIGREYAELSPDGPEHAEVVLAKLAALWAVEPDIPASTLAGIAAPTLVLAGEHDVIRRDHTEALAAAIPGARVAIVDGTTHMLVREKPAEVAARILEFLD